MPIEVAAANGNLAIVQLLVDAGVPATPQAMASTHKTSIFMVLQSAILKEPPPLRLPPAQKQKKAKRTSTETSSDQPKAKKPKLDPTAVKAPKRAPANAERPAPPATSDSKKAKQQPKARAPGAGETTASST